MTKIFTYPVVNFNFKKPVFVLGGFESFHLGHLELLKTATKITDEVIVMLIKDPSKLPKNKGKIFSDLDARIQMMANSGVKNIILFEFDNKLQQLTGQEFTDIFIEYKVNFFVVGKNFVFGKNASWGAKQLSEFFPKTKIIEHLNFENSKISTKNLKLFLEFGDFENLNKLLPTNFLVSVEFNQSGKFTWKKELICPAAGFYLAYFVIIKENIKLPVILQIEFTSGQGKIHFFQKNENFSGFLEIIQQIRYIYSNQSNILRKSDIKIAKNLFAKLYQKD
ncbi:riboflavin biosynthesis protein [Mycoplasma sp. MF12]|uniref:FAD synthase n=1 Tax=Mesomycoplasma flocculare TaxID=2128 RepID=UPI00136E55B2|nr:adenylyltransferase/cytidyltransferase family protein [Mesomycoplasma flocculare]MXR12386.1 riboflavin biosynthesis protein [Mesomycoplasma flocculare]MXR39688.1 riboflavin biosynthesis protein [Mycoplasma sp. MF12]